MVAESAWFTALNKLITGSHVATAHDLVDLLDEAGVVLGMRARIYLADLPQRALRPVPPGSAEPLGVDGTVAGRSFRLTALMPSQDEGSGRPALWLPLLDGTERVGVLHLVLPEGADPADGAVRERCWALAGLVGHLVVAKYPYSDLFHTVRRTEDMTVASELLWQLLPPSTFAGPNVVVSAIMEPFARVGGDGFDYAVDRDRAYLAVFDSTGHDLRAGLTTSMVLAATRNARRAGADLAGIAAAADDVLDAAHVPGRHATAVLVDLDLHTGVLSYVLAGHPPPVVLRRSRMVKTLAGKPRPPLGLRHLIGDRPVQVHSEALEPGDRLLLHTDGVTEARNPEGVPFGLDRLVDLTERHEAADLPAPETLRRVVHAVLEHQNGQLQDDATLMLVEWSTTAHGTLLPTT
ncbi:Serine phosphatase RsbU, regulator of sigma subunit [Actinokineospora spheciospongiae]|uniref:Serine phosphatase RsbU, regulator of sigma subunit n=1 Tax=Actinokineospora spheciospongiae TaxID=909613 RepID=W7IEF2_9PSEU|nr:PP2C family protein-serine/threonine phosphatase [Actinokineospora spheciospongiae]EWC59230.1 Serine phosphatase RsbU, regulator of sigma subunit [Actinokineospora spheciospongiae]PWW63164.1 stage II sporulation protein E [Actinokineospora spheciospongiae]